MFTLLGLGLTVILIIILVWVATSLPLFFAAKMMGGDASLFKVFLTNTLITLASLAAAWFFGFGGLFVFLLSIPIYMLMFQLGFLKAIFALLIQYILAIILAYAIIIFFGLTVPFLK
jgi:hypothetical protein